MSHRCQLGLPPKWLDGLALVLQGPLPWVLSSISLFEPLNGDRGRCFGCLAPFRLSSAWMEMCTSSVGAAANCSAGVSESIQED